MRTESRNSALVLAVRMRRRTFQPNNDFQKTMTRLQSWSPFPCPDYLEVGVPPNHIDLGTY